VKNTARHLRLNIGHAENVLAAKFLLNVSYYVEHLSVRSEQIFEARVFKPKNTGHFIIGKSLVLSFQGLYQFHNPGQDLGHKLYLPGMTHFRFGRDLASSLAGAIIVPQDVDAQKPIEWPDLPQTVNNSELSPCKKDSFRLCFLHVVKKTDTITQICGLL